MTTEASCIFCSREITNPICSRCNFSHFVLWINEKPLNLDDRIKIIKRIKKSLFIENGNSLDCIICHDNEVSVCSYCFFRKIENILYGINLEEETIEDFKTAFNFSIYSDYAYLIEEDIE